VPGENVKWVSEDYIYLEQNLPNCKPDILLELLKLAYDLTEEPVVVERYMSVEEAFKDKGEVDHDQRHAQSYNENNHTTN